MHFDGGGVFYVVDFNDLSKDVGDRDEGDGAKVGNQRVEWQVGDRWGERGRELGGTEGRHEGGTEGWTEGADQGGGPRGGPRGVRRGKQEEIFETSRAGPEGDKALQGGGEDEYNKIKTININYHSKLIEQIK